MAGESHVMVERSPTGGDPRAEQKHPVAVGPGCVHRLGVDRHRALRVPGAADAACEPRHRNQHHSLDKRTHHLPTPPSAVMTWRVPLPFTDVTALTGRSG